MLDANELARRLREAMDRHHPKVLSAHLADACGVTPQAVNGWRKTGRIAKGHLQTIAQVTGKPLTFFLWQDQRPQSAAITQELAIEEAEAIKRLRDASHEWRNYVLALAMIERREQDLMLKVMREAVPDYVVEQAYGRPQHQRGKKGTIQK